MHCNFILMHLLNCQLYVMQTKWKTKMMMMLNLQLENVDDQFSQMMLKNLSHHSRFFFTHCCHFQNIHC